MDLVKILLVFIMIIVAMKFKKPLYISILVGIIGISIFFNVGIIQTLKIMGISSISQVTISLVLSFYSITFLQRMLEKREHLFLAEKSLSGMFNSRRVNAMLAPFIIGLLPSAGSIIIAAPIVDNAGGDFISQEDKTFITSYFRHISEAFLPTYSSIILALQLSGVDMTAFVVGMLPMVLILFLLGYLFYVRKIPKETGLPDSIDKKEDTKNLIRSLWTIALTIVIILFFKCQVYIGVIPVIIMSLIINKFSFKEVAPMFISAFESKLIISTVIIMMFKDVLTYTGVINKLPQAFGGLPVPTVVIFSLIFIVGTMVAGSQAIIAISMPLAFAAIPYGGLALMILLMCLTYMAMQISPTHICLAIVTVHFNTSFFDLVKRTIPIMVMFLIIVSGYCYFLYLFQ